MLAAQILSSNDKSLPKPDFERILHLYRRSANAGHSAASLYLGKYYQRNNDLNESIKWLMKSATHGNDEARKLLRVIQNSEKQMRIDSQDNTIYEDEEDNEEENDEGEEKNIEKRQNYQQEL